VVSVNKERVLRWVQDLREEQEKTTREEARKEEILQMLQRRSKWLSRCAITAML